MWTFAIITDLWWRGHRAVSRVPPTRSFGGVRVAVVGGVKVAQIESGTN